MESWVYTQGKLKGREEGRAATTLQTLRGVFASRLGRPPSPEEEEAMARRARALSPEQLIDVFKMPKKKLLAWLLDPG